MVRNVHFRSVIYFIGIVTLLAIPLFSVLYIGYTQTLITPNDEFFSVSIGSAPELDISTWNLTINGHINNQITYNYSLFTSLPSTTILATLQCVEGYSGTALWKGVLLKDLLNNAQLQIGAMDVVFHAADSYSSSLTINEAMAANVLLAYEMNGEPLPVEQGYPVRVVAPDHFGYKWVKWVVRIEVVDYDYLGYWESRGWSDQALRTSFSYWGVHATLFSISFMLGGIAYISGLKFSRSEVYSRDLFPFITPKLHRIISIIYNASLFGTFIYWAFQTYLIRSTLFYTLHGTVALIVLLLHIMAAILGSRRFMQKPRARSWHHQLNLIAFMLLAGTVALGFLMTLGLRIPPN